MAVSKFKLACEEAARAADVSLDFTNDGKKYDDTEYETNGFLYVRRGGMRACFEVGNDDIGPTQQNVNTRIVLKSLGIKVNGECIIEEEEVISSNVCPHCGGVL